MLEFFDHAIEQSQSYPQFVDAYVRTCARAPTDVIEAIPNTFVSRLEEVLGPSSQNRVEVAVVPSWSSADACRSRTAVKVVLGKR